MRRLMALLIAIALLCSCGEPKLECGADAVMGTLSSMVRDRVLRVAADGYPASYDADKRAALSKATRVTPRETKLVEWDTKRGHLRCEARVVVDAPGPEVDTNQRHEAVLRYGVTRDTAELFLVEVAYDDLMRVYPPRVASAPEAPKNP
jgi:hypothetical protein